MRGMDAGPGTDLGSFAWFVGIWLTMTMAMMLPSAAPTTLMFSHLGRASQTTLFVAGYLLTWTAFGIAAYAVSRLAREAAPLFRCLGPARPVARRSRVGRGGRLPADAAQDSVPAPLPLAAPLPDPPSRRTASALCERDSDTAATASAAARG